MTDDDAMDIALTEARAALAHNDVPVGAVVVLGDRVLAARHNEREHLNDPTAHAEVLALRDASAAMGSWHLDGATLVVTLEPCVMCAGAAVNARVARVVFGAADLKAGSAGSLYNVFADPRLNHNPEVNSGVRARDAATLLEQFFSQKRS
jgi:tRNA(adenine34) deaminase